MIRPGPTALAVLFAILAMAAPIRAQTSPHPDSVRYRAPDGTIKTISKAEQQSRVADLKQLIDDLNNNRKVLLTASGTPIPVTNDRIHEIAKWLEKKGGLTALEIPGWIDDQLKKSRDMIPSLTDQLEGLTSNPQLPLQGTTVEWPVPMDWRTVKAKMDVNHNAVCRHTTGTVKLQEAARLDLLGDGRVNLVFGAGTNNEGAVSGSMVSGGLAAGQGRMAFVSQATTGVIQWRVTFNRMNDELVMTSYQVGFVPDQVGLSCDPSELTPTGSTDQYADEFPDPMSWLSTKGAVQGDFTINCSDGNRLEGTFRVQLNGDGNAHAAFEQENPPDQVLVNAWLQEREGEGYAELSAPGKFGRYNWNISLKRDGNKITPVLNKGYDLRFVPNDGGIECYPSILANIL